MPHPPGTPRTTVVIATRDRADELAVTLRHLARLGPVPPIIVVDNGSDDHTVEVVRRAGRKLPAIRGMSLPRALRQRRRLPDEVERQVRTLERSAAGS